MEFRILQYFLTVAEEENFSRAAEVLHITQPTLSRQIAQLETELGVQLFHRGGRRLQLTDEGYLLRRRAEEILQLAEHSKQEIAGQRQIKGTITIGCGEMASMQYLAEMLVGFHREHPDVTYHIYTATADIVREQMDKGIVDIGLLMEPVDVDRNDYIRMPIKERWVVFMRPDDVLAAEDTVTPQQLVGEPLILPMRSNIQNEVMNWLGKEYNRLQILATGNLNTNCALLVAEGMGRRLAIEGSMPFLDPAKLITRPLKPELVSTSVLAWKRQQPMSPAAQALIDYIHAQKA